MDDRQGQVAAMRYSPPDLPILSAELFDDRPLLASMPQAKSTASSSRDGEDGPRKRARTTPAEAAEPEDGGKRARGRPRLDTNDETAADRRRTQIRLAQRAYRNRKETAIQTLEKKVQKLADANEEMSHAFMQLHDVAIRSGLLDRAPEFGRQLRATTEKFLALAREASDDDDDANNLTAPKTGTARSKHHSRSRPISPSRSSSAATTTAPTAPTTPAALPPPSSSSILPHHHHQPPSISTFGYEVITHPTPDNASFAYPLPTTTTGTAASTLSALSNPFATPHPSLFHPTTTTTTTTPLTTPPISSMLGGPLSWDLTLPPPDTYAPLEATFGRRLHRYACERAMLLITMPSPPPQLIQRVFGFCLLFETPLAIRQRLARALGKEARENLSEWGFPFYHLGGAGAHGMFGEKLAGSGEDNNGEVGEDGAGKRPVTGEERGLGGGGGGPGQRQQLFGNQGTRDVLKPRNTAGFAPGPFSADISGVRDDRLDKDMRMTLPGFAGEYFDPEETEMYLYERGVVIPPGMDVVTVEVDTTRFGGYSEWQAGALATVSSLADDLSAGQVANTSSSSLSSSPPSVGNLPLTSGAGGSGSSAAPTAWPGLVDPTLSNPFAQADAFTTAAGPSSTPAYAPPSDADNAYPFPMVPDGSSGTGYNMGATSQPQNRQRFVIDVRTLVIELSKRASCLGRTPGFRESDINASFWAAVEAGVI